MKNHVFILVVKYLSKLSLERLCTQFFKNTLLTPTFYNLQATRSEKFPEILWSGILLKYLQDYLLQKSSGVLTKMHTSLQSKKESIGLELGDLHFKKALEGILRHSMA